MRCEELECGAPASTPSRIDAYGGVWWGMMVHHGLLRGCIVVHRGVLRGCMVVNRGVLRGCMVVHSDVWACGLLPATVTINTVHNY